VSEVAVIAVAHERWGERPAALVVAADADPTPDELIDHLRDKVASWELPDVVEVVPDLPHTGVGKIDKRRVRDENADRLERAVAEART
jgi:fatty-acyl-CoA synthase